MSDNTVYFEVTRRVGNEPPRTFAQYAFDDKGVGVAPGEYILTLAKTQDTATAVNHMGDMMQRLATCTSETKKDLAQLIERRPNA